MTLDSDRSRLAILLACAVALAAAVFAVLPRRSGTYWRDRPRRYPHRHIRYAFRWIRLALDTYCLDHSCYPPGPNPHMVAILLDEGYITLKYLAEMGVGADGSLLDGYGQPFRYYATTVDGFPAFSIYSFGANMTDESGWGDDLSCGVTQMEGDPGRKETWHRVPSWFEAKMRGQTGDAGAPARGSE